RREQREEHEQHEGADPPELLVHATTSLGWPRTASDSRRRIATMSQFARSAEPPAARNGVVRPVSGTTRVTPPITMKTWSATTNDRPTPRRRPKSSWPAKPIRKPRETKTR